MRLELLRINMFKYLITRGLNYIVKMKTAPKSGRTEPNPSVQATAAASARTSLALPAAPDTWH